MFKIGNKHKIYKLYNEDIWAVLRVRQQLNNTFLYFVKKFREETQPLSAFSKSSIVRKSRKLTLYSELLTYRKKLFYFYGGLKSNKNYSSLNAETLRLHLFLSTILDWEFRLSTVLYRLNFCSNSVEGIYFVMSGAVAVNREVIRDTSYVLKPGDIVEITESFRYFFTKRIEKNASELIILQPPYFEVNFSILTATLLYYPSLSEIYYPFEVNLLQTVY